MEIENKLKNSIGAYSPVSLTADKLSYSSTDYVMYNFNFNTGQYKFISPLVVNLTGYTLEELNRIGFKSIVDEVTEEKIDTYSVDEKSSVKVEEFFAKYKILTKLGEHKWIEDNSFTYLDEKGKRTFAIGILRDTSALQQFIKRLNNEKANLDKVFDLADTMLIQVDKLMNIQMINKKGCEILGGTKEEILGKNLEEFIPSHIKQKYREFVESIYSNRDSDSASSHGTVLSLDGKVKIIEWRNTILRDREGDITSIISAAQEITTRRKEQKIRKIISEILEEANAEKDLTEYFSFIHRSISKLMKAENFYIAYYNRQKNLLTFPYFIDKYDDDSSPQKLGKGLTEYVLRTGKSALVTTEFHEELERRGEAELIGPPSEIWLGVPLKIRDKVIGAMVLQDYEDSTTYTEEEQQILDFIAYPISRAIERKIVEKEKEELIVQLKELNKSKDQLFSLISHDLRGPFNSLLGFADILITEFDTLTRDEMKEYLNVINESAKNLFGMTNNLLHYSRLQLGKYQYHPVNLNLNEAVQIILETQKNNIKKKNLLVIKNIDPEITAYSDEDLLNITLDNIVGNAIKFTEVGGTIKIVTELDSDIVSRKKKINLKIIDDGVGISQDDLKRIANREMFSNPGTLREFGTGLGLQLSYDLCKMNKSLILIDSEEGKGTTVTIQIPASKEDAEQ